jgi:hypothetical protein
MVNEIVDACMIWMHMHQNLMDDDFWCIYICLCLYIDVYVLV